MTNFIEVARLQSCQKSDELWLEEERIKEETKNPYPISVRIQNCIKTEVFRISTRSERHSIRYPFLCM